MSGRRVWCLLAHRWWAKKVRWPYSEEDMYLCHCCGEMWSRS